MEISEEEFEQAERRAQERRRTEPYAVSARYDEPSDRIVISLSTGAEFSFPPRNAQGFETAQPGDLDEIEITPSGFGIIFPKIDADLYVPGLLKGLFGTAAWTAARMGMVGGQARSEAKQVASRANGKLGGRPRKVLAGAS